MDRAYNDPQMGAVFNGIARMFAPMKGQEVYAYAKARSEAADAARLADLYDMAKSPNFNQALFDRTGAASGRWTPNQGYYAVDQGNATTLRKAGIDNAGAMERTRFSEGAATARQNALPASQLFRLSQDPKADPSMLDRGAYAVHGNAAHTFAGMDAGLASKERTNAADNQRAVATTLLQPVAKDAYRPAAPGIASLFGMPDANQPVQGQVSLQPGERVITPDGRTLDGAPKPLTESEMKAQERQRLNASGLITDQMLADTIIGEKAPVQVVDPATGKGRFSTPGEAARTGAQPYEAADANKVVGNFRTPDQRTGTAIMINGNLADAATKQPLPPGTTVERATVTGAPKDFATPTGATMTEAQKRAAEVKKTTQVLDRYENLVRTNPGIVGAVGGIRSTLQNLIQSGNEVAQVLGGEAQAIMNEVSARGAGMMPNERLDPRMFDPNIDAAQFLRNLLAYRLAQMENPNGEVGVKAFERANQTLGEGLLGNTQSVLARLAEFRAGLAAEQTAIGELRSPGNGQPTPAAPPGAAGAGVWPYEGKIIQNDQGVKMIGRGGKWEPM